MSSSAKSAQAQQPLVSVIVPAFNAARTIARCLTSILESTWQALDVIVINDGSSDNTEEIVNSFADGRIRCITTANQGVSRARNTGLHHARADYIVFVDADDALEKEGIEILMEKMLSSHADLVLGSHTIQMGSRCFDNMKVTAYTGLTPLQAFETSYPQAIFNQPWGKLYKKQNIWEEFDPSLSLGEDLLFNLHYLQNCHRISAVSDTVYRYSLQLHGLHAASQPVDAFFALYHEIAQNLPGLSKDFWMFFVKHTIRYAWSHEIACQDMYDRCQDFLSSHDLSLSSFPFWSYSLLYGGYGLKQRLKS